MAQTVAIAHDFTEEKENGKQLCWFKIQIPRLFLIIWI